MAMSTCIVPFATHINRSRNFLLRIAILPPQARAIVDKGAPVLPQNQNFLMAPMKQNKTIVKCDCYSVVVLRKVFFDKKDYKMVVCKKSKKNGFEHENFRIET